MSCRVSCSDPLTLPSASHPAPVPQMLRHSPAPPDEHDPQALPVMPELLPASSSNNRPGAAESPLPSTAAAKPHSRHTAPPVPPMGLARHSETPHIKCLAP